MWATNHHNPEVAGPAVSPGDTIYTDAFFDTASGTADMTVYDSTNGAMWDSHYLSSYKGVAANTYYDGSTSDYITEAPTKSDGSMYYLRHPSTGSESIPWIVVTGFSLRTYPSRSIAQVSSSHKIQSSTFNGSSGWSDVWHYCS